MFYSDRNAYRVPDYYRVDLAFNIEGNHKVKKLAHSSWTWPSTTCWAGATRIRFIFRRRTGKSTATSCPFWPPIPTVTYNFRF